MTFEGHFDNIFTVDTLCAQLTRNLLARAKFLVLSEKKQQRMRMHISTMLSMLQRLTHAAWMKQMMCRGPTSSSSCVHSVRARSVQVMSQMTRSSALHACTATGVCSRATLNHRVDL